MRPMTLDEVATPLGLVELDTLERNNSAMNLRLQAHQIANRPHIKVHRLPHIAQMQTEPGEYGIACQTVAEAENMVDAGFSDVMITNSFVGGLKLRRILALSSRASLSITADSAEAVIELSELADVGDERLRVYVECDIGGRRAGFADPEAAAGLAVTISRSQHLEFGGLAAYLGGNPDSRSIHAADVFLADVVSECAQRGVGVPAVSVGGTVFAMRAWPDSPPSTITEARPGNYSFFDATKVAYDLVNYEDCALRVISTVVSRPNPSRVILDAGWRVMSSNPMPNEPTYGHILEYPEAKVKVLYTEHAIVDLGAPSDYPRIGERVTIVPNSCDGVLASIDSLHGIRDDKIEETWQLRERSSSLTNR